MSASAHVVYGNLQGRKSAEPHDGEGGEQGPETPLSDVSWAEVVISSHQGASVTYA